MGKIRIITHRYAYMGLECDTVVEIEVRYGDTVTFKHNGKTWVLKDHVGDFEFMEKDYIVDKVVDEKEPVLHNLWWVKSDNAFAFSKDVVNSPAHYDLFDGTEAIEIIARSLTKEEFRGYCFGNLLKYRLRCGKKDDVIQELNKADKYKELYENYKEFCRD